MGYTTNLNWWSPDFLTINTNSPPFEHPCWTSDLWMLRKATLPLEAAKEAGPDFATQWQPTQKKTDLNVSLFQLTRWFSVFFFLICTPVKQHGTWKMMVGRKVSFWNGPFLGHVIYFLGVLFVTVIVAGTVSGDQPATLHAWIPICSQKGLYL